MAVMLATFKEVLDTTITSLALPNIAGSLAATNEGSTWVLTSYLVANAIVLPASGWLALRFGRKRFLLACTALFTLASLLCALAPSMGMLILARILQGASGGAPQTIARRHRGCPPWCQSTASPRLLTSIMLSRASHRLRKEPPTRGTGYGAQPVPWSFRAP